MQRSEFNRLDTVLWRLLVAAAVVMIAFGLSGIALITLGFDEAWILSGIDGILRPKPESLALKPVITSGGLYALGQLAIGAVAGTTLWAHRMFCLACTLGVLGLAYHWGTVRFGERRAGLLTVAGLLATPGLFELGTTAYAALPAMLLVLLSAAAFFREGLSRPSRWVLTGVLAGLAAATRLNCVVLLPALVVAAFLTAEGKRRRDALVDALLACVIAAAVMGGSIYFYGLVGIAAKEGSSAAKVTSRMLGASFINYPFYLNKWIVFERLMSLPIMALITVAGVWMGRRARGSGAALRAEPWVLLLPFAWLAWGLWVVRAPIGHLRYLFPALAAFGIISGLAVAALDAWGRRNGRPLARLAALLLALSFVLSGLGATGRNLVHGNGNILSWEWEGRLPLTYFTRFRHRQYQRDAAEHLRRTTGEDELVLAIGRNYELGYLADRGVLNMPMLVKRGLYDPAAMPRRLVITPIVGTFLHLREDSRRWLEENCVLEAQFGPYAFYGLTGSYPEDPAVLGRLSFQCSPPHPHTERYP